MKMEITGLVLAAVAVVITILLVGGREDADWLIAASGIAGLVFATVVKRVWQRRRRPDRGAV